MALHSTSFSIFLEILFNREHAPSIIFMDEIDSIGSARMESDRGNGDSEVQRTMLEQSCLAQGLLQLQKICTALQGGRG